MEHQLWKEIVAVLKRIGKHTRRGSERYSDADIVRTWFWSVLHDRPTQWACVRENWPIHERRCPLPSQSRMSRRLRTPRVDGCWNNWNKKSWHHAVVGWYG